MKKKAIILAGNSEVELSTKVPNQFITLRGKPLLYYAVYAFLESFSDMEVILVLPEEFIALGQEVVDGFFDESRVKICTGGETRFESVKKGLMKLGDEECIVFIHESNRCFVSTDLICRCYEVALTHQAVVPVIKCKDGVRVAEGDSNRSIDREAVRLAQTPQAFHSTILKMAFEIDYKPYFTDELIVVESFGINIHHIAGEEKNFKIVTPLDLELASKIMDIEKAEFI